MGRPVSSDLTAPHMELQRYFRAQHAHANKHGYPTMAAFAKDIARGTVSLAPQPEDPQLEFVGKFVCALPHKWLLIMSACYDNSGETVPYKALKLRVSVRDFYKVREQVLWELRGYLKAVG